MTVHYSSSQATPRADLGEALEEYRREDGGNWIAQEILKPIPVALKEAEFSVIKRASILQDADNKRAMGGKYNRVEMQADTKSYKTHNRGIEVTVDDSERKILASEFDVEVAKTKLAERIMRVRRERRAAALLFSATTWAGADLYTDYSVNGPWSNKATSILDQLADMCEKVRAKTGQKANQLILSRKNLIKFLKNTELKAQFPAAPKITKQMLIDSLPDLADIDQLLVGDEVYDSAGLGAAAVNVTDIWGEDYVMVAYSAPKGASIQEPGIGRIFRYSEYVGDVDTAVEMYRQEDIESDVVRVKNFEGELVYDAYYAHLAKVKP